LKFEIFVLKLKLYFNLFILFVIFFIGFVCACVRDLKCVYFGLFLCVLLRVFVLKCVYLHVHFEMCVCVCVSICLRFETRVNVFVFVYLFGWV